MLSGRGSAWATPDAEANAACAGPRDPTAQLSPACARARLAAGGAWDPTGLPGGLAHAAAASASEMHSTAAAAAAAAAGAVAALAADDSPLEACAAAAPRVSSVLPGAGPLAGGTLLTILGSGFGSAAQCRLGEVTVPASQVTAHQLRCLTPAVAPRRVPMRTREVTVEVG